MHQVKKPTRCPASYIASQVLPHSKGGGGGRESGEGGIREGYVHTAEEAYHSLFRGIGSHPWPTNALLHVWVWPDL